MKLDNLTKGEQFIIKWQYHALGDFELALITAIAMADIGNRAKLAVGFPDEVEAYVFYSTIDGWWAKIQQRVTRIK